MMQMFIIKLADGTMTAYDFMYSKIEDLEITPGTAWTGTIYRIGRSN